MIFRLLSTAAIAVLLVCCGNESNDGPGSTHADSLTAHDTSATAASHDSATPASKTRASSSVPGKQVLYGPATGTIVMKGTNPMGEEESTTIYFEEHGARQAIFKDMVAKVAVAGDGAKTRDTVLKISNVSLMIGGETITFDPQKNVGTRSPTQLGTLASIPDFAAMSDAEKNLYNYKSLPARTIIGRETMGHQYVNNGMTFRVWTWSGVPLRTELDFGSKPIVSEAVSATFDTPLPPGKFAIPTDVKFQ